MEKNEEYYKNLYGYKDIFSDKIRKFKFSFVALLILTAGLFFTVYQAGQRQEFRQRASEPVISSLKPFKSPYKGYIVEFKEDPLAKYIAQEKNKGKSGVQLESAQNDQKSKIDKEHLLAKEDLLNKLGKKRVTTAAGDAESIRLLGEYTSVSNGVALDITDAEAKKLKDSSFVKKVSPNYEVKSNLTDSIHLINADDVWQLKDSLRKSIAGNGVKAAVLDTGVDYSHRDLGASQLPPEREFKKIIEASPPGRMAMSSDGSKFAFLANTYYDTHDYKIYVYSSTGQKLNEISIQENSWGPLVVEGDYLAFLGDGKNETTSGLTVFNLKTGERKRLETPSATFGSMNIYRDTLYYGISPTKDPTFADLKFKEYNFLTGQLTEFTPPISPLNNGAIVPGYDKGRVAFPIADTAGRYCGQRLYVWDITLPSGTLYNTPNVAFVIDFKGDEILYAKCYSSTTVNLLNIKTGSLIPLSYSPGLSSVASDSIVKYSDLQPLTEVGPQSGMAIWAGTDVGAIGNNVIYFSRDFHDRFSSIIIYNKSQQKYYKLNLFQPISKFNVYGDTICFPSSGILCHTYNINSSYNIPPEPFNSKVTSGYNFIYLDEYSFDNNGHGTHVASIIAGNNTLKGVAPEANIISYKVLNSVGSGYFSTIIAALDKIVSTKIDADSTNDVGVVNMSLGANCGGNYSLYCGPDDPLSKAVDSTVDAGVVVVVAAGNSGPGLSTISTPGTARKAITVGAISKNKQMADFSSRGPVVVETETIQKPDIVAPGVEICAAAAIGQWITGNRCQEGQWHMSLSGTSMATPHVVGLAALMLQVNPSLTPAQVKSVMLSQTQNLGFSANDQGEGMVDALKAVKSLLPTPLPTKTPSPTSTPCLPVITYAWDPKTGACKSYPTPCDVPDNWEKVESCKLQSGLFGEYFDNLTLASPPSAKMIDSQINFNWDKDNPPSPVSHNNFSVRWTGQLVAPSTGTYTFAIRADDGTRLTVNNQLIIRRWGHRDKTEDLISAPINLSANTKYAVKVEYLQEKRLQSSNINHVTRFKWQKPGTTAFETIPSTYLKTYPQ